jgi:hypothetical protein
VTTRQAGGVLLLILAMALVARLVGVRIALALLVVNGLLWLAMRALQRR